MLDRLSNKAISIHAPREGGDLPPSPHISKNYKHFNPRPPRGGRQGGEVFE